MPRPGLILVHSSPKPTPDPHHSDSNTAVLTRWYETKHIPDVLAMGGVSAAARYCLISGPAPSGNVTSESGQVSVASRPADSKRGYYAGGLPYLAVYTLPDMDWLHEEGCAFWRVPLVLGEDDGGGSVFEVGVFETGFWERVEAYQGRTEGEVGAGDEGLAQRLVVEYLDATDLDKRNPEEVLFASRAGLGVTRRVRSTLFKTDESRPAPPSLGARRAEEPLALGDMRYMVIHEVFDNDGKTISTAGTVSFEYTLLSASDEEQTRI